MKAIVAIDKNNGIAKNNDIPFNSKSDLNRFKRLTLNSNVIMGRKTFEAIIKRNGKPLEKRLSFVITRNKELLKNNNEYGFHVRFITIEEASSLIESDSWIIGGKEIYEYFEPYIKEWYITRFYKDFDCDIHYDIYDKIDYNGSKYNKKFINAYSQPTNEYDYRIFVRV